MNIAALKNDSVAVSLSSWGVRYSEIKNTKILNNEIVNSNDGIQLVRNPMIWLDKSDSMYGKYQDANCEGTIIDGNHIYIDSSIYTDGKGNFDPNGIFAYAEDGMDFKVGSENANNPMIVSNNHLWGFRRSDSTNSYISSSGVGIGAHFGVNNVQILNNVIFDSASGISTGDNNRFAFGMGNSVIKNNILYNVGPHVKWSKSSAIKATESKNLKIEDNLIIGGRSYYSMFQYNDSVTYSGNEIVDTDPLFGLLKESNAQSVFSSNTTYETAANGGYTKDYTFTTDRFTNNPRTISLKNAVKHN
jgi:hypothetical protein